MQSLVGTTGAAARQSLYPTAYARVDEHGLFRTIVTTMNPERRQGEVLHYQVYVLSSPSISASKSIQNSFSLNQQRRVLTVRECARAQGFSDGTDFHSVRDLELDVSCRDTYSLFSRFNDQVYPPCSQRSDIGRSGMVMG